MLSAGAGFVTVACLVLVRDDSTLVSRRTRRRLVVTIATFGVAVMTAGGGSGTAADLVGLIGFPLTVLGLLALNSRERPGH